MSFHRQELQHGWEFRAETDETWRSAVVPGCNFADLERHKLIPDPFWGTNENDLGWVEKTDWRYRVRFPVDADVLKQEQLVLVADGLDTLATVTLNGQEIGKSDNMFYAHRWVVKGNLKAEDNELEIRFHNPMDAIKLLKAPDHPQEWNDLVGGCTMLRKEQCSFGWDWGPRLPVSGIYLPIYLEAWSGPRIAHVGVKQSQEISGGVEITVTPELFEAAEHPHYHVALEKDGGIVAKAEGTSLRVEKPQLWWPAGWGAQPLYQLTVQLRDASGNVLDAWTRRIGLRTIELQRKQDEWGESFQFAVNGQPIFAKGANWIPAHSYPHLPDRDMLAALLDRAVESNMNMMRVWGGGLYEKEAFYDLCDEKGLLVWQDFMFACGCYPGWDPCFVDSVRKEARYQVRRLAHRACLALWCGNNEIEQGPAFLSTEQHRAGYQELFYRALPAEVEKHDGVTSYWPSSPHNPLGWEKGHNDPGHGDAHFWDVWHARKPVSIYEKTPYRFVSEFGMQSMVSTEVAATFAKPEEMHLDSAVFEHHQKNKAGNAIMFDYIQRLYRPKQDDYGSLAYLSQLNQSWCMQVAIEYYRRSMPRTMGALFWQINDCWPVFSWSSISYPNVPKALHFAARRFFAPVLVTVERIGGENPESEFSADELAIVTVFDGEVASTPAKLSWDWNHLDGRVLERDEIPVTLQRNESVRHRVLATKQLVREHGVKNLYLRLRLVPTHEKAVEGSPRLAPAERTVFLAPPKDLALPLGPIEVRVERAFGMTRLWHVTLVSPVYQHQVEPYLAGVAGGEWSDAFFDLFPNEPKTVMLRLPEDIAAAALTLRIATRTVATAQAT